MIKISEQITIDLIEHLEKSKNSILIPNYYFRRYEMDLIQIFYKSEYITEYEIKISKTDFLNDFKKSRSKKQQTRQGRQIIKEYKHELINSNEYDANKFYFVVPEHLINIEDVPKGLGLIYWFQNKTIKFKIVKPANFIHKNKINLNEYKKIAKKLSFRENTQRIKNIELKKRLVESNR